MDRRPAGFTLIESMATLAVVGIGLAIGVPSYTSAIANQRVATAMHLLSTDLAMARSAALMRRRQVVACPGDQGGCRGGRDWSMGWVVFVDADQNRAIDSAADVLRVEAAITPPSGAGLRMPASRDFVRYQRDGRSAGTNLTIRICPAGRLRGEVVINNVGRVRTQRHPGTRDCTN